MTLIGSSPTELEPTGERFHPTMRGAIRYEHLHRYALCLGLVEGLDVLDIASGEGYGSALLASRARKVIGVDIDPRAVEHARRTYYHPNVRFLAGDCAAIPLADAAVDVVVSFETLEHIDGHDQMLSEIRRVLRPGGRLVISSPNKLVYSDDPGYENPYHVRELYYDEFVQLLERNFASVRVHGQRLAAASFVYPLVDRLAGGLPSYGVNGSEPRDGLPALDRPMYFIAVCGDAPHDGAGIDSLFVDAHEDLVQLLQDENARAHSLLRVQQDALQALRAAAEGRTLAIEGAAAEEPLRLPSAALQNVALHRDALPADAEAAAAARRDRDEIHADRLRLQRRLDAALRELQDVRERADAYGAERNRLVDETAAARDETVAARNETIAARNETVAAQDETVAARDETVAARDEAAAARGQAADAASAAQHLRERLDALGAERDTLAACAAEERRAWETERARSRERAEAIDAERGDLAARAERERSAHAAERSMLQHERDALVADLEHAAERVEAIGAERDAVTARAERDRAEHAADRSRLQSRLDALTAEIGGIGAKLGALAAEREKLAAEREKLAAEREKLAARAEHAEQLHAQLLASRSWRLTAPLRELAKTFK